jgi:hypothetical protein
MDTWVWIVIAVAVVVVILLVAFMAWSRARRHRLHDRWGREYDRTVDDSKNRRQGERELRERESEHEELELQPLSDAQRARYTQQWEGLQGRFVDRPQAALADADGLLTEVMRVRGYPVEDFDSGSRLVSVDHPDAVENYRKGHAIYEKNVEGRASTEDLRVAVVCYRSLFEELVEQGADA